MSTKPLSRIRNVAVAGAGESETRPINRDPIRAVAVGRDGKELTRKRRSNTNAFYIDASIIPDGWDYQWNTYSVFNEQMTSMQVLMAENGWRPVPAERHEGYFMPAGYKGPIIRDGLVLEERPKSLSDEARAEEREKAIAQKRGARQQFGIQNLPESMTTRTPGVAANTYARAQYESGSDIPRPRHQVDLDE